MASEGAPEKSHLLRRIGIKAVWRQKKSSGLIAALSFGCAGKILWARDLLGLNVVLLEHVVESRTADS